MSNLCRFLFPKMGSAYGGSNYGPEFVDRWEREKRVAAPRYFPQYFQLSVPKTEVSEAEFAEALRTTASAEAFGDSLRAFGKTDRFGAFIDRLRQSLRELGRETLVVILQAIFIYGDEAGTEGTGAFGAINDHIRFAGWLLFDVLHLLGDGRFQQLIQAMCTGRAIYTSVSVASMCENIVRGQDAGASQPHQTYPDLAAEEVSEMRSVAVGAIREAARNGRLVSAPRLPFILYRWREWTSPAEPAAWIEATFLRESRAALQLIFRFTQTVSSLGLWDKVAARRREISFKDLGEFADLDRVTALVRGAADADLSGDELAEKRAFLKEKANIDSGASPSSLDMMLSDDD